jgi:transcriptional regulator with XRE-family HTH domain
VVLAEILQRNRLKQKDVAKALGVSRVSVGAWMSGRTTPSGARLVRLLGYLRSFEPTLQVEDLIPSSEEVSA